MNGGILIPLGPGIPPGDVNGFCGFNCGFLSAVPGRMFAAAAAAVTADVSFVLSSDCFWSLEKFERRNRKRMIHRKRLESLRDSSNVEVNRQLY